MLFDFYQTWPDVGSRLFIAVEMFGLLLGSMIWWEIYLQGSLQELRRCWLFLVENKSALNFLFILHAPLKPCNLPSRSPTTHHNMTRTWHFPWFLLAALGATWTASTWWMESRSAAVTPAPPDPASSTRWPTTLPTTATTTTLRSSTCGGEAAVTPCCPTMEAWWTPSEPWWCWSPCWRSEPQKHRHKWRHSCVCVSVDQLWFLLSEGLVPGLGGSIEKPREVEQFTRNFCQTNQLVFMFEGVSLVKPVKYEKLPVIPDDFQPSKKTRKMNSNWLFWKKKSLVNFS